MYELKTKRVYEEVSDADGYRILVDRVWPRGISKKVARIDCWKKDMAPSAELRKWFGHISYKYAEFAKRYEEELNENQGKQKFIKECADYLQQGDVTLVYAAKSTTENNAAFLKSWILEKMK
jgi:uncharacterized protein YeaO (DUF488 family)